MLGAGKVGDAESSDPSSTADVISSWNFCRLIRVSRAAGTVILGLCGAFVGVSRSIASSVSDAEVTDEERSYNGSFRAPVLPALLSSLIGGVRRRAMRGGRAGAVAVRVLLSAEGGLILGRSFI